MMRLRSAGTIAALAAMIPLAASASDTDDALKLAARAATYGMGRAVVVLHAPPEALPTGIPLPNATLLGSLTQMPSRSRTAGWTASAGSVTTVTTSVRGEFGASLFYDATDRDAVLGAYAAVLQGARWTEHRWPPYLDRGGFAPSLGFTMRTWCRPDRSASIGIITGEEPSAFTVQVAVAADASRAFCGTPEEVFSAQGPRNPLPTFAGAPGLTIETSGPASDGTTTGARITSTLGGAAVFDVFARQLVAVGWAPKGTATTGDVRAQTFTKTVDGVPYVAMISVHALDATHYVALADVSTLGQ